MIVYRPKDEPQGAVIDMQDGSLPAYIPICAKYAYKVLKILEKVVNDTKKVVS